MKPIVQHRRYVEFKITEELKRTLDLFILEIIKILKVETVMIFFNDSDGNLKPYNKGNGEEEELDLNFAKYCFENQKSDYFNLDSQLAKEFSLKKPYISYILSIPEGDLGIILVKNFSNQLFFENDFHIIKNIFASFSLIIQRAIFYKKNLYIPFNNSILLLLENSSLIQTNQDLEKKLYSLLEVSNIINSSKKLEEMIQNVLKSATKVLRAESASVFLIDLNTGDLVFDILSGNEKLKGIRVPKGKGIAGKCAETKQAIIVNDVRNNPDFYSDIDKISQITTRNLMACPLIVNNDVIGVIEVINTIDRKNFSEEDMNLFQSFSDSVAIAIQRRRLIDYIEEANLRLEQKVRELTTLHNIAQILVQYKDFETIADKVLETIQKELKISRLSFLLYDSNLKKFKILASRGFSLNKEENISPKLLDFIFEKKIPFYTSNFDEHPDLHHLLCPERYHTKSAIIIPLIKSDSKPYGVICATDPENKKYLENEDFRILMTVSSQISKAYETIEFTGVQKEIEITAKIQKNILPSSLPKHKTVEIYAKAIPSKTTGGDFFDYYIESPYGDVFFIIADVSGKSLPAALFMAVANSILRTIMRKEKDPSVILSLANDLLFEESESGMFVTVFLAKYDSLNNKLVYSSAGHNHMLLIHQDGSYQILQAKGMPLGVLRSKDIVYEKKEISLKKDDLLVLYTDGATESVNMENQEYGLQRLIKEIVQNRNQNLEFIANHIYRDILEFTNKEIPDDDFTLLLSRFHLKFHNHIYTLKVIAKKENIPLFIDEIANILQKYKMDEEIVNNILLVCDEIVTNICFYAYKEKDIKKPFFISKIEVVPGKKIKILFVDEGVQYDFYNAQKPDLMKNLMGEVNGGFGIYLVQKIVDKTIYKNVMGKNYLLIIKKL